MCVQPHSQGNADNSGQGNRPSHHSHHPHPQPQVAIRPLSRAYSTSLLCRDFCCKVLPSFFSPLFPMLVCAVHSAVLLLPRVRVRCRTRTREINGSVVRRRAVPSRVGPRRGIYRCFTLSVFHTHRDHRATRGGRKGFRCEALPFLRFHEAPHQACFKLGSGYPGFLFTLIEHGQFFPDAIGKGTQVRAVHCIACRHEDL